MLETLAAILATGAVAYAVALLAANVAAVRESRRWRHLTKGRTT